MSLPRSSTQVSDYQGSKNLRPVQVSPFLIKKQNTGFSTNVFGAINVTRAFLPYMRERKTGTIFFYGLSQRMEVTIIAFQLMVL